MIIKKFDIENFGKFSGRSIDFKPGFNLIFGNNEDGKSTLMAFTKLMFYGNLGKSTDIAKNLRKKYTPWSGASMSGSIEFESGGESFRLHKKFQKSAASDLVSVYNHDKGEKIDLPPSQEIGQVFLDMDLGEFERSFFIENFGGFSSDASGDSLAMRIANLSVSGDESISQSSVMARISAALEELVSKSQKKGLLVEARERIETLKHELSDLNEQTKNQLSLMTEISELKTEITTLEQSIEAIDLKNKVEAAKKDLKRLSALAENLQHREELLKTLHIWNDDIASLKAKTQLLKQLLAEIPNIEHQDATKITHDDYRKALVLENELSSLEKDKQIIDGRFKALVNALSEALNAEKKKTRRKNIIGSVLLSIFFGVGIGMFFISQYIPWLCLSGLSAVAWLGLILKKHKRYYEKRVDSASKEYEDCIRQLSFFSESLINETPEQIQAIFQEKLSRCLSDFDELLKMFGCNNFEEFKTKAAENFGRAETIKSANQLKEKFTHSISQFAAVSSFEEANKFFEEICSTLKLFEETEEKISVMTDLSGFDSSVYDNIESQISYLSEFIENSKPVDVKDQDVDALKAQLTKKRQLLGELQSRTTPPSTSEDDILIQLSEASEYEKELSDRYKALSLASKTLEDAISEMNKGLGSLLNKKTGEYLSKISGKKYSDVLVSRNLEVEARSSLADGYHQWKHLSSGAIDKIYFALRLAAADIIVEKSNPLPLFLDDILTQYDNESCKNALSFLNEYLKKSGSVSQIFFFTCHKHISEAVKEIISDYNEIIL